MTQPAPSWQVAYHFQVDEPYLLKNKLKNKHWAVLRDYKTRWYWLILAALGTKPERPLMRAWLRVDRGSYGIPPDPDGMNAGFAPILDLLTLPRPPKMMGLGLIYDDSAKHIKPTVFHHVKTRKGEGFTRVIVYRPD